MHVARRSREVSPDPDHVDHRVFLHDVSWKAYEALLSWRGERSVPRITYLEGELELMTPSIDHEDQKKKLARLVEAWAEETETRLTGVGSWTLKRKRDERGAEPDECYVVGDISKDTRIPDFAIEVVWTSGGIDKLDVYRKLGVREVWIWESGALAFHRLSGEVYVPVKKSTVLPAFDVALVTRCMTLPQTDAVAALRKGIRRRPARTLAKSRRRR